MKEIRDRPEIWPCILLSIILHAIFFLAMPWMGLPEMLAGKEEEVIPVEFLPADAQQFRIADIKKPEQEQKPDKAKFLGMYDSAVPEEQVGVTRKPGSMGKPARRPKRPVVKRSKPPGEQKIFAFDQSIFDKNRKAPESSATPGDAGVLDDFYPDFKRGVRTYLNVLRYPGVAYFVRLKRAFKIAFNPEPSLREHFSLNRVTRGSVDVVLGVSVDRLGNLSELFIFRSSGIPTYDREALRTVRASAPFSSPPEKFVDKDGQLRMSWTFSVYL